MADYAAQPRKAKEDQAIIDLRQRMLATFLNRCRKMKEVREDGVWWRFLDPNASWSEVLHSHPVSSIPKNNLKAPPLDPANPSPGHAFLPIPSSSAKLRSASVTSSSGTPTSPAPGSVAPSSAAHTTPGPQVFGRFPPDSQTLPEGDLDPYFVSFESSSRELEALLNGSMEKINKRLLSHLYQLSEDLMELGGRYNAFSLSESAPTVCTAIERTGQACDFTYVQTRDLASNLSAQFAEPMRESAQFAGIVRSVLKYRIQKRVQEEMTRDELEKKKTKLDSLERSELEAKRIEQYLSSSSQAPRRSMSTGSNAGKRDSRESRPRGTQDDTASIDSDFPPTHGANRVPSATQGAPEETTSPTNTYRRPQSGNFVTNKIFGRLNHAIHGMVDVDPERTRRDEIGKTKESLVQLEQALEVAEKDVKDASAGILKDLKRYQGDKEDDLRKYMLNFARCHIDWSKRCMETWVDAKNEVNKVEVR
ncbi:Sorting nexin, cytoplasm-to-vacuole targeting pathway/endosomal sorting [Elasticomyces elasticus]|nr:Sorting nexin, cytoplasm-to-vacuole targeting pathway/endosomal sorting [Elasticomyces elasticus]